MTIRSWVEKIKVMFRRRFISFIIASSRAPVLESEVRRRLVGQNDGWVSHDGPGDSDPLLLAAGELGRPSSVHALEADFVQDGPGPLRPLAGGHALKKHDKFHVLEGREDGNQVKGLKDEAHLAASRRSASRRRSCRSRRSRPAQPGPRRSGPVLR